VPQEATVGASTIAAGPGQLDLVSIVKMSQVVSREIVLEKLVERLMAIAVEHAGATRGLLILPSPEGDRLEAEATAAPSAVAVRQRRAPVAATELPESLLRFIVRTHQSVLLDDATSSNQFSADPYLQQGQARSVLGLPLVNQGKLMGVLYLENRL